MAATKHRKIHNVITNQRRLHHSSRVKFPFVNKSASWFWCQHFLIWTLGSKLILSNNQSSATLLGSGHVSLHRTSSLCLQLPAAPFGLSVWVYGSFGLVVRRSMNVTLLSPHPTNQEQGIPSIRKPESSEIISDSEELWDSEVCFLHIQLVGKCSTFRKYIKNPLNKFLNPSCPEQNRSLGTGRICSVQLYTHTTILSTVIRVMNFGYQTS